MKKALLIILPLLLIIGCSKPSLCDCIKKPFNEVKNDQAHCKDLMKKQFGTKNPSVSQMKSYAERNCGGL